MVRVDASRGQGGLYRAVTVLLLGVALLAREIYNGLPTDFSNWWAWLFLAPAIMTLNIAWGHFRAGRTGGAAIMGMMFLGIAVIFITGIQWARSWPVLVIAFGLALLVQVATRSRTA